MNPNFGARNDTTETININSFNQNYGEPHVPGETDREWCRLRSKEPPLLPSTGPQVQPDPIQQSLYTEETNPAIQSIYLERGNHHSSKNQSPRDHSEHLKKAKQRLSRDRRQHQMGSSTDETMVLLNDNHETFHRYSPSLATAAQDHTQSTSFP